MWARPQSAFIQTTPGLQHVAEAECRNLLGQLWENSTFEPTIISERDGLSITNIGFRPLWELALKLQTPRDIYWELASVKVTGQAQLRKVISRIPWSLILPAGTRLRLKVKSFHSRLFHESLLAQEIGEALHHQGLVVDQQGTDQLFCWWHADRLRVLLAMGGEPFYQRRFRQSFQVTAPLAEHLAASMSQGFGSFWQEHDWELPQHVLVPFAGSGTLGFEYAIWATNIPPLWAFRQPALLRWLCAPQTSLGHWRERWRQRLQANTAMSANQLRVCYVECDHQQAVELRANIESFRQMEEPGAIAVSQVDFELVEGDFFAESGVFAKSKCDHGVILLNPPFGQRLTQGDADSLTFYRRIGEKVRLISKSYDKTSGVILLPNQAAYRGFVQGCGRDLAAVWSTNQGGRHLRIGWFFWS